MPRNFISRVLGSKSGFDAFSQRAKVADALHFVIRQLDAEMVFESRQQFKRLQAVNAEGFEKIVVRRECRAIRFEMGGRKRQNFVNDLFESTHNLISPTHQH